jgi:hypothetical protein
MVRGWGETASSRYSSGSSRAANSVCEPSSATSPTPTPWLNGGGTRGGGVRAHPRSGLGSSRQGRVSPYEGMGAESSKSKKSFKPAT